MKERIVFCIKCYIILMGVSSLGLSVIMNPLAFMDEEAPYYLWNKEIVNSNKEKYDIIILGDSVANAAYVPEILSNNSVNLALGGTTPIENYYTMQDWLKQNSAPKVCYISFMDFHLQKEDCFWTRSMYFHRYDLLQNIEILKAAQKFQEPSILTKQYFRDFLAFELYFPSTYITPILGTDLKQRYDYNVAAWSGNELHSGRYIARGIRGYESSERIIYDEFYTSEIFDYYYRKLIELCIDRGIKVHLIKLPLPNNTSFTAQYINQYNEYYDQIKMDYPEITVDWLLTYPQEFFMDAVHLNSHGALEFSTMLKGLCSEEFGNEVFSLRQAEAIDDAIKQETTVEWIIRWVQGKDYTILFYDKNKRVIPIYEEILDKNTEIYLQMKQLDSNVFYLSGLNTEIFKDQNSMFETELGGATDIGLTESKGESNDLIKIVVIDNYNNIVVCEKKFQDMDGTLILRE